MGTVLFFFSESEVLRNAEQAPFCSLAVCKLQFVGLISSLVLAHEYLMIREVIQCPNVLLSRVYNM